jgi:hypothetical protein
MTIQPKQPHPRTGKGMGPRPHTWKSGPDPAAHVSYRAWLQCRNQAHYRREPWSLTFEQWQQVWQDLWHRRGRGSQELCITRLDCADEWCVSNVIVITRKQNAQRKTGLLTSQGQGPSDVVLDPSWAAKP